MAASFFANEKTYVFNPHRKAHHFDYYNRDDLFEFPARKAFAIMMKFIRYVNFLYSIISWILNLFNNIELSLYFLGRMTLKQLRMYRRPILVT